MSPQSAERRKIVTAIGIIAAAALAAYINSFSGSFLFDDLVTIKGNPSIRNLWSLGTVLSPPNSVLSVGRPILNLSFALNYAMGGLSAPGYHAFNLLVHALAGITLFGIVRVSLSLPRLKEKYGDSALLLALAVAILWTLHPIQTESVSYISQRAESLMGLFYLLTLYFFIRAALSPARGLWAILSVVACALGMMTKEVMVSAPLAVLFYDRTFIAGTFREAWQKRWRIYSSLAATWLLLAALMASASLHHRGLGYDAEFTWWTYVLTESRVVVNYLKLALWPNPLVFDYGPDMTVNRIGEAAPYLLLLLVLLALTVWALRRAPSLGFLGAWFFLVLAPTSSVVPVVAQPMAENRVYLPLAAIVTLEAVGLYALIGRKGLRIALPALALVLGILTARRNSDYRDEVAIWSDTALKQPGNSRAHYNLANILAAIPGRLPEAIDHYEAALRIKPLPEIHNNLGIAFANTPGRLPDAVTQFEAAVQLNPDSAEAQKNLKIAIEKSAERLHDEISRYEAKLRSDPDDAVAHNNLGAALAKTRGRLDEAIAHFEAALKIRPDYAEAHFNLGHALLNAGGRSQEAWAQFDAAVRLRPDWKPVVARLQSARP